MNELFLSVLNMSLTASYVILFVILVRLLLKKAPKVISYALWGVVAFRLIIPFSFESMFSLMPRSTNAVPIPHDIIYQQNPQINSGLDVIDSLVNQSLPAPAIGASVNPLQIYIKIGAYIWALGIIALLVYSLVSVLILKRQLKSAQLIEKNIFEAKNLKTPFVLGLIKPKIYLPIGLNAYERSYILLHEQTHIHRKDHMIKIVAFLILPIHWFNPLVWIAFILMSADMELSCDERVLKEMNEDIKKPYANSLLSLAAGRHILNGSPLAFGEGNIKGRIKNVLNYKKPRFWIVTISIIVVIAVGIGLMANPKDKEMGFGGVNAVILEIDKENQTMTVKGIDNNSVIGNKCILTWDADPFITVATNSKPKRLSLDDFSVGDYVVIFIGEVQESYPTRAKAMTIQLQPKEMYMYPAGNLWNARTKYVGNNSAIGKLLGLLPLPPELHHKQFELLTNSNQRGINWILDEDENATYNANDLNLSALLLFALVDNLEDFSIITKDPFDGGTELHFNREWADNMVGEDVRNYAESPDKLQELIDFPFNSAGNKLLQDQTSFDVESNLAIIMSSPKESSNPQDYINAHKNEYENFFKYGGEDALQYMLSQFEAGNAEGLQGQIMMRLCKDLLGARNNVIDDTLSPQEWYNALDIR